MKIDHIVLHKFEKISHWFEKKYGRNCFFLARISLVVYAISMFWTGLHLGIYISIAILFPIVFFLYFKSTPYWEKRTYQALKQQAKNPIAEGWRVLRMSLLLMQSLIAVMEIAYLFVVFPGIVEGGAPIISAFSVITFYYFLAATPLPPGSIKEKKKGLVHKKVEMTA